MSSESVLRRSPAGERPASPSPELNDEGPSESFAASIRRSICSRISPTDCGRTEDQPAVCSRPHVTGTERAWTFFESRPRATFIASFDRARAISSPVPPAPHTPAPIDLSYPSHRLTHAAARQPQSGHIKMWKSGHCRMPVWNGILAPPRVRDNVSSAYASNEEDRQTYRRKQK